MVQYTWLHNVNGLLQVKGSDDDHSSMTLKVAYVEFFWQEHNLLEFFILVESFHHAGRASLFRLGQRGDILSGADVAHKILHY